MAEPSPAFSISCGIGFQFCLCVQTEQTRPLQSLLCIRFVAVQTADVTARNGAQPDTDLAATHKLA
ncbi:Uncharacterised protein [Vibrio cholerae]|nr:Uncharacterised protein [Vibrio cholerae]